ncbi:MAG: HupE/UreJ family protein [Boseongicola sp.]
MGVLNRRAGIASKTWSAFLSVGLIILFFTASMATNADAHARNENYVWINLETNGLSGRFEITYEDIRERLGVELPEDPEEIAAAISETAPLIQAYIKENFEFLVDGEEIDFAFGQARPAPSAETRFAAYDFTTETFDVPQSITLRNDILLSWDAPLHRSLAVVEYDRVRGIEYPMDFAVLAFGPNNREQVLDFANLEGVLTPGEFVWQGFIHVVAGPDHVLFLLALLFTTVLFLQPPRKWEPVRTFGPAAWNAIVLVTLFAIAHSATLALTVLGIIQPNIRLIETLIAFSIVAVAANNLRPVIDHGRWLLIVFFGLFHGMGFASAMSELQFRLVEPVKILLNFNIGIELGQLLIVLIVLPLFYLIRRSDLYRKWLFTGGNLAIIAVAGYWTVTRAFDL